MEVITVFGFRNSLFCSGPDIGSLSTKSAPPLLHRAAAWPTPTLTELKSFTRQVYAKKGAFHSQYGSCLFWSFKLFKLTSIPHGLKLYLIN